MKKPPYEKVIKGVHWYSDKKEILESIPGHLSTPGQKELKKNKYRTLITIPTNPPLIMKTFEDPRFSQKVKERISISHAGKEWAEARFLQERGVNTTHGLAYGEIWEGNWVKKSIYLMKEIPESRTLSEFLSDKTQTQNSRNRVIQHLARFIFQMQEKGICHRDLHGNNILYSRGQLYILDLSTVWHLSWFPDRAKESNLEKLVQSFEAAGRSSDAYRFCKYYLEFSGGKETGKAFYRKIQKGSKRRHKRHLERQTQRAVKNSSQFVISSKSPFRIFRSGVEGNQLTKNLGKAVGNAPFPVPTKEAELPGWAKSFPHPSRARAKSKRAWLGLRALEVRRIPAPRGFAWLEFPHGETSWIFMEEIKESAPLGKWFRANNSIMKPGHRHSLTKELALLVRKIHSTGIYHNDYSPKNFLIRQEGNRWVIHIVDPESVQLSRSLNQRRKIRNLSQIADLGGGVTKTDRLRFLKWYLGEFHRDHWSSLARQIWRETQRRISARISRTGQSEPTEP